MNKQSQKAASAYITSEQILPFCFEEHNYSIWLIFKYRVGRYNDVCLCIVDLMLTTSYAISHSNYLKIMTPALKYVELCREPWRQTFFF